MVNVTIKGEGSVSSQWFYRFSGSENLDKIPSCSHDLKLWDFNNFFQPPISFLTWTFKGFFLILPRILESGFSRTWIVKELIKHCFKVYFENLPEDLNHGTVMTFIALIKENCTFTLLTFFKIFLGSPESHICVEFSRPDEIISDSPTLLILIYFKEHFKASFGLQWWELFK